MAQLIIVEGENRGKTFDLTRSRETLGSSDKNTIVLNDRRLSSTHAEIFRKKSGYEIKNLDHSKALTVNGEVFKTTRLQHGDWIQIADTTFVFSEDSEPQHEQPLDYQTIDTDDLLRSQIQARRKGFLDAESMLESLDRSQSADHRVRTLLTLSHKLSGTLDLRRLGERVVDQVLEIFSADRVFILTMDEDQRRLKPLASRSRTPGRAGDDVLSRTIFKEVLNSKEGVLCTDALDDARFLSGQSIVDSNVRAFLCVPCVQHGRIVAILQVDSSQERSFSEDDLELLTAIANFVAVHVDNCKAYRRRQEYNQQLFHLGRATQRLSSFLDREQILKEVGKLACQLINCTKASVIIQNPKDGRLQLASVQGMTKEVWAKIRGSEIGERFCRKVIEEGRPLLVQDVREHGYTPHSRYASNSFLIVPIVSKGGGKSAPGAVKVLGTISLADKVGGGSFSGNDQKILDILAGQLAIALKNAELYEKATVDGLTRVYLRRFFEQRLDEQLKEIRDSATPLSLLMLDIDHFKHTNDTYGHQAGDEVLQKMGALLKKCVRPATDTVARYGGEEFTIILPGADAVLADKIATRILKAVSGEHFTVGDDDLEIRKTVSIGVATVPAGAAERENRARLVKKADYALYEAKESGRNRAVTWSDELLRKLRRSASARHGQQA
ncbi:MAG: diguanylate cyclase [Planctomycetes bacterium]|nr:diguanylate cyclase [Planctomycetota bacterium]